jgi:hypothetical protein
VIARVLLALALALAPAAAAAYPAYRQTFRAVYGTAGRCQLCHVADGDTARNPFGSAWQDAGENQAAFRAIEASDSDDDGVRNVDEIRGGSNPGDKDSTPKAPGAWKDARELAPPVDEIKVVLSGIDEVQGEDIQLTPEQVAVIEAGLGRALTAEERAPTLFYGVKGGKRRSAAMFALMTRKRGVFALLIGMTLSGKVQRVVLLRAGDDTTGSYIRFLKCLAKRTRTTVPAPGAKGCPRDPQRDDAFEQIAASVRAALWTVHALR